MNRNAMIQEARDLAHVYRGGEHETCKIPDGLPEKSRDLFLS
jgi:hypothetical protein